MDEQRTYNNKLLLSAAVCIITSVLFSKLSLGSLFFNIPLLLFVPRIEKKLYAILTFVITWVLMVAVTLFDFRDVISTGDFGVVFFALYFQTMASIGAIVWTGLRDYSDSVLRKLVICSYPIAVLGIVCSIVMSLPCAAGWVDSIKVAVASLFDTEVLGINSETFATMFVTVLLLITAPIGMVFSGLPILLSEVILRKTDETWQFNFANMKMPNIFVWILMGTWAAVLLTTVVVVPTWVAIIVWNVALGLALHYFMSGVSIVVAALRRKSANVSAGRVIIPVMILSIVPGLNVAVVAGLSILGALETWIKLR